MKKHYLTIPLIFLAVFTTKAQYLEKENLGLISYLTDIKIRCEYRMTSALADKKSNIDIGQVQSAYNSVLLPVNRLINQLSADMIERNNLNVYRNINKFINKSKPKLSGKYARYQGIFEEIDRNVKLLLPVIQTEAITAYMMEQIVGTGKLGVSGIESARDFREKKVGKIVTLLKDQKLKSVSELNDGIKNGKEK
jgi:hypothetical protein